LRPPAAARLLANVALLAFSVALRPAAARADTQPNVTTGAAVQGPFTAASYDGDLRGAPTLQPWRPGDPEVVRHQAEIARLAAEPGSPTMGSSPPDPLAQTAPVSASAASELGALLVDIAGIPFTGTSPPDTVGAIGDGHFIQMVNHPEGAAFAVYDRQGQKVAGPTSLATLWPSGVCRDSAHGDPIVVWDHLARRWVLLQLGMPPGCLGLDADCHLCVAVSKTADPVAGGWWLYDFADRSFPDYPKLGVWPDAFLVGSNLVLETAGQLDQRAGAWALQRDRMLAGQPAAVQRFSQPKLPGFLFQGLLPATLEGEAPPAGTPGLFLRARDGAKHDGPGAADVYELWEMRLSWSTPQSSTLTGPLRIPMAPLSSQIEAVTEGDGSALLARAEPLMWPVTYRRRDGEARLTGSVTVAAEPGHAGVRWFQLREGPSGWAAEHEGTWSPSGADRFMSSATSDHEGNLAVLYSILDDHTGLFPGLRYSGRLAGDPPGILSAPERTFGTGAAWHYNGAWGDYGSLRVDPQDGCTFWGTHQVVGADQKWRTRIGAFRFAECEPLSQAAGCTASTTAMCLQKERFEVTATWRLADGTTGSGRAVPLTTDSGFFWFFAEANIEMVVKVIDGCALNQRYWVFAGGLTNVGVDLQVRDTTSGEVKTYTNQRGTAFAPIQDTAAFATCP
jgi:hypothetical protein